MVDMMSKAKILVMVSHDLTSIAKLCQRALWMDHGTVRADGPADQIVTAYDQHYTSMRKAA
jgi:ABC-type polysaccharide/polyol phosphate transport system ATPase subunit